MIQDRPDGVQMSENWLSPLSSIYKHTKINAATFWDTPIIQLKTPDRTPASVPPASVPLLVYPLLVYPLLVYHLLVYPLLVCPLLVHHLLVYPLQAFMDELSLYTDQ